MGHRPRTRAEQTLAKGDRVMARLIAAHGPCALRRRRARDPFQALVSSIVAQMISTQAARTVHARLLEVLEVDAASAAAVLRVGEERLRTAGLSRTKARAIRTLAERVSAGALDLEALRRMPSERVRAELVALPGLGPWTANMFLMFHLARPDVFPAKDLGVQEGMRRAYALPARPTPREAAARAEAWAPYRSTAAWYLWRVLEEE